MESSPSRETPIISTWPHRPYVSIHGHGWTSFGSRSSYQCNRAREISQHVRTYVQTRACACRRRAGWCGSEFRSDEEPINQSAATTTRTVLLVEFDPIELSKAKTTCQHENFKQCVFLFLKKEYAYETYRWSNK